MSLRSFSSFFGLFAIALLTLVHNHMARLAVGPRDRLLRYLRIILDKKEGATPVFFLHRSHVNIFVAFSGNRTPKLENLTRQMQHPTEKTRISQLIPCTHKILGPALGAADPTSEHSFVMKDTGAAVNERGMYIPNFFMEILHEIKAHRFQCLDTIKDWLGTPWAEREHLTAAATLQMVEAKIKGTKIACAKARAQMGWPARNR